MSSAMSVYLDLFRMLAALVVFLSHTAGSRLTDFVVPEAVSFGAEAVAAFFVLSGFVIGYVAEERESSPQLYATSRLARLYSVALPAIVVTLISDTIGRHLQPDLYAGSPAFWQPATLANLLPTVLFVNELWSNHVQLGTNGPYWSLGYEVWYYILFGLLVFLPKAWRIIALVLWLAVVGPRIALALPIWLMGYLAYRFGTRQVARPWVGLTLFAMTVVLYLPVHLTFGQPFGLQNQLHFTAVVLRGYLYYYALGFLICLNFVAFSLMSGLVTNMAARIARPVRWLAGATFTFYLLHMPVAVLLCALSPRPPGSSATRLGVLGGTLLVVLVLAELGERRKRIWRRLFAFLLSRGEQAFLLRASASRPAREV